MERLMGVNNVLVALVGRALSYSPVDFGVACGLRTYQEQEKLFAERKTRTMKSKHLVGEAVDLYAYVDGKANYSPKHYILINEAMQQAAKFMNVSLRWGGDWDGDGDRTDQTFNDLMHWELIT